MIEEERRGTAPHGIILAVVVSLVVIVPFLLGDGGEALTEAIAEILSPIGLLLVPIALLLVIQFLSSDRATAFSGFSTGEPDSIHRLSGSPVGVALILILILFLLYNRVSLFGSGDDDDE
ncbi:transmembrane protein [Thalictrum thalictroides]|uniref:Transmembrane protein n=1 Tax=Thalictrum thalictroides TaxID=46969 RepID=A0A7J6V6R4_THATH|nr:transmembrane protein [Thalictrum thalictroides]